MGMDLPPPVPAIEISIASRGYSKGVAQTDGAQLVVRPEVAFGNFRISAYGKNVTAVGYDIEAGLSAGYRTTVGKVEWSGSATVKRNVDADPGIDDTALELNVAATRSFGALKPRLSLTYSPDDLGSTRRSYFWEAGSAYSIGKGFGLQAGVGLRRRAGGADYTSLTAAVTKAFGKHLTGEVRLYDTSRGELGDNYDRRVVVSLRLRS